jgi:hypothetical protein
MNIGIINMTGFEEGTKYVIRCIKKLGYIPHNIDYTTSDEIFGNYGSAASSGTLWISGRYGTYISGAVYFPGAPIGAGTYHLMTTRNGAGNVILYLNGNQVNAGVLASSIPVGFNFRIGADVNGAAEPFTGSIYSVRVYNRVLSAKEVKQNFDALRGRYGL